MDKMATTFTELCKLADFETPPPKKEEGKKDDEKPSDQKAKEKDKQTENAREKIRVDGLVYNIQIVLPESRDQAVYDALFRSLREHLG